MLNLFRDFLKLVLGVPPLAKPGPRLTSPLIAIHDSDLKFDVRRLCRLDASRVYATASVDMEPLPKTVGPDPLTAADMRAE